MTPGKPGEASAEVAQRNQVLVEESKNREREALIDDFMHCCLHARYALWIFPVDIVVEHIGPTG